MGMTKCWIHRANLQWEQELSSVRTQQYALRKHSNISCSPEIRSFQATMPRDSKVNLLENEEQRQIWCAGVVWDEQGDYMTVNLLLVVVHVWKLICAVVGTCWGSVIGGVSLRKYEFRTFRVRISDKDSGTSTVIEYRCKCEAESICAIKDRMEYMPIYMSIESVPLVGVKLKFPCWVVGLKPKAVWLVWVETSSPASSSSEKYFSIML